MKTQMTQIGIGIAALSALAAEDGAAYSQQIRVVSSEMEVGEWKRLIGAAKCLGGCREAARVFGGSPTAPDPVFEMDKKV